MKTTDELARIASFGGGMILDNSKTTDELARIASFLKEGATLTIRNAGKKTTDELARIASFGKHGSVIFDFTE